MNITPSPSSSGVKSKRWLWNSIGQPGELLYPLEEKNAYGENLQCEQPLPNHHHALIPFFRHSTIATKDSSFRRSAQSAVLKAAFAGNIHRW